MAPLVKSLLGYVWMFCGDISKHFNWTLKHESKSMVPKSYLNTKVGTKAQHSTAQHSTTPHHRIISVNKKITKIL
jgi:hypothetical protein